MSNVLGVFLAVLLAGCAQPARMGMVEDPSSGIMSGSAIEKNIVLDAGQLENRSIKVNLRNVSGDTAYDLASYQGAFLSALQRKGFRPADSDEFGVKFDVNVLYSGYVRTDLSKEFLISNERQPGSSGELGRP